MYLRVVPTPIGQTNETLQPPLLAVFVFSTNSSSTNRTKQHKRKSEEPLPLRAPVLSHPRNNVAVPRIDGPTAGLVVPRTTIRPRPLENAEVPSSGGSCAGALVPIAPVFAGPLKHGKVSFFRSAAAGPRVPGTAFLAGKPEHAKVAPASGCGLATVHVQ